MKIIKDILLLICMALLWGCSQSQEMLPGLKVPVNEMNTSFTLIPNPGGDLTPKNNELFDFEIRNLSDQEIIFPGDFGLKIFLKKNGEWKKFEDNLLNYPEQTHILPTRKQFPLGRDVAILPSIPELYGSITLRVVVAGYFENQPDKWLYGYADIKLEP